ncbi:hypothetical protein EXIGLDRAFT_750298 [Exidia glandulosa HHB12029]|uniref:Uncharacterized protein n=2 Tax=Exidia glandulosa HHB12029 TaxID=1314781 RepID=A0A166AE84_EXIGL|nr:hypothetical protein EXIGLDRAFT_750298 [Exidia glandulosa HHB12029]
MRSEQQPQSGAEDDRRRFGRRVNRAAPPSSFPSLPSPDLDGELLSYAIEVELKEEVSRIDPVVKKRASNVLKLAAPHSLTGQEENSRLTAELKALSDRLDAAERKKREAEEAEAAAAAASGTTESDAPGSNEGPWNQALRWEQKLGARLNMLAVVDPDIPRVQRTLEGKRAEASLRNAYANTEAFSSVADLVAAYKGKEDTIRAFVVGTPPAFRGGVTKGTDIELQIVKAFPKAHLFVEKPVAAGSVKDAFTVGETIESGSRIVGVAYMLRYLKAVGHIKKVIAERGLTVMATHARYACAYTAIAKPFWWDKSLSGGPVVEQGTHFCDLSRFFGGKVVPGSVQARATEWNEPAGKLAKVPPPVDESKVPEEQRIPRVTSANWKYESGAVGSLLHVVGMQGTAGSTGGSGPALKPNIPLGPPLSPSFSDAGANGARGQRMLNGRVYGAARSDSPQRSARNTQEPQFVEWGYGGMGSVQNRNVLAKGGAAADWGKLQSNASNVVADVPEEEDDGSGMAWVRRRRAQREKERLEKERQEREAAAAAPADPSVLSAVSEKVAEKDDDTASTHEATSSKVADIPQISIHPVVAAISASRPETPTASSIRRAPSISRNTSVASAASAATTIKEMSREAKETDIADHTFTAFTLPARGSRPASPSPERSSGGSTTGDDDADEEDEGEGEDSTVEDDAGDDEAEDEETETEVVDSFSARRERLGRVPRSYPLVRQPERSSPRSHASRSPRLSAAMDLETKGRVVLLGSTLLFILGLYGLLLSAFTPLTGVVLLDLLAQDVHYKYFSILLVPTTAYFVIANWVGWQYFRNA